jgi:hypothetical protein
MPSATSRIVQLGGWSLFLCTFFATTRQESGHFFHLTGPNGKFSNFTFPGMPRLMLQVLRKIVSRLILELAFNDVQSSVNMS